MSSKDLVLVVDDDPGFLKGLGRLLRMNGFKVEVFDSAEALQYGANLLDAVCLVLDIHLGDASGIEIGRELAKAGASIPIIYITANDSETVRKAALETECIAYLSKPFPGASLVAAIEQARGARGA